MEQPVAKVNKDDISRIIRRDYSNYRFDEIIELLKEIKSETEYGKYRVWAAVLKISNGNIKYLMDHIKIAQIDYRDVIAYAEYPLYMKKVGFNSENISTKQLDRIIMNDWEQYKSWLLKT